MRYHLFQKFFVKMAKIKEMSFLLSKCLISIGQHCKIGSFHAIKNHLKIGWKMAKLQNT